MSRTIMLLLGLALIVGLPLAGCVKEPAVQAMELQSDLQRDTSPLIGATDLAELTVGNTAFALDLYQSLREGEGNLFFSPYSISLALAMTYAGARGETEREMAQTLHFTLSQDGLHHTFNALDLQLSHRGEEIDEQEGEPFRLNIANSIWGQRGYDFLPEFLDTLAMNYGAGLRIVDYIEATEEARQMINQWVSDRTEGKIKDLIQPGVLNELTRLVLANAIYFNAGWFFPFAEEETREGTFQLVDGGQVSVPMMSQTETLRYSGGDRYQVVELPYVGREMAMVILLPEKGMFEAFEMGLNNERLSQIFADLNSQSVALTMPKFEYESEFSLKETLSKMGMHSAFTDADFSGMDGTRNLFISEVVHKAFVSVDETGTEAAAATAVIVELVAAPSAPVEMTVDRPFIYLIRDLKTGTFLFVGRVLNPAE
ncbi:MAG TPA: serpin family protein [Anaerolineae bacterium]|nr:serpin family protein [Anaerolineae bacterium]